MAQAVQQTQPECLFVKWATPTEEALSTVKLAHAYCERSICLPEQIAIAVPNRLWAANVKRAAESLGIDVSLCIPQSESARIHAALEAAVALEQEGLQGMSLVHRSGLDELDELAHALLHVQGDESAEELCRIIRAQLSNPSVAALTPCIPVVLLDQLCFVPDYLFIVGCVEGLIPPASSKETQGEAADVSIENARRVFNTALETAKKRATISYFVKAPEMLAAQLHIAVLRYKNENGTRMAMVGPSQFITEKGQERPTTTGGQTLLRAYGLN